MFDAANKPAEPLIQWSPSLACGRDDIDEEHAGLLTLINQLATLRASGAAATAVRQALVGLRAYTRDHFGREQRLMMRWPVDPGHKAAHLSAHGGFIRCLDRVESLFESHGEAVVDTLLMFLVDWLTHHIQTVDRALVDQIERLQSGRPCASADSDGSQRWIDILSNLHEGIGTKALDLLEANRNLQFEVDRRQRVEAALRASEERFASLYRFAPVALLEVDWAALRHEVQELQRGGQLGAELELRQSPQTARRLAPRLQILSANEAALEIFGHADLQQLAAHIHRAFDADALPVLATALAAVLDGAESHEGEVELTHARGDKHQLAFKIFVTPPAGDRSRDLVIVAAVDVTERNEALVRLRHMALHDSLTGLPNRTLFQDRLMHALVTSQRDQSSFALLNIDLNRFKTVNDSHGHEAGDELLRAAAERIQRSVRASDTVARVGGDEFLVLLPALNGPTDARRVASAIGEAMAQPLKLAGGAWQGGASIGIALYPRDGRTPAELYRCADAAMYAAKHAGTTPSAPDPAP